MKGILLISLTISLSRTVPLLAQEEFVIDTSIVYVGANGSQLDASVVFNGDVYFVVWVDAERKSIFGARVDTSGRILDPAGIPIATESRECGGGGFSRYNPSVAFDGKNHLVVWDEACVGIGSGRMVVGDSPYSRICGRRVNSSGTVLDKSVISIRTREHSHGPLVVFDGSNYFVVWNEASGIYGARIDAAGVVFGSQGIPICTTLNIPHDTPGVSSMASDGKTCLIVWSEDRSICGARVDASGDVLDIRKITISTASELQRDPSVTFGKPYYFVVWGRYQNSKDVYGARIDRLGTVLDSQSIPISVDPKRSYIRYPCVDFDGANYIVTWKERGNRICGIHVDTTGTAVDSQRISLFTTKPSHTQRHCLAFDGKNYFMAWDEHSTAPNCAHDICGRRVNTAGTVLDSEGILISRGANSQGHPSMTFDGHNYFVVWQDNSNGKDWDVHGALMDASGRLLKRIPVSTAKGNQVWPNVAVGRQNYFVVWKDYGTDTTTTFGEVCGARVGLDGSLLDLQGIRIPTESFDPQGTVAFDGENYLVVQSAIHGVYGTRVTTSGVLLDSQGFVISKGRNKSNARVAFGDINYLVVWDDNKGYSGKADVYGTRVSKDGEILDPKEIAISTEQYSQWAPHIAFDGENYLVVWSDRCRSGYCDINGARISQAGEVLDTEGIPISATPSENYRPSVVFNGTNYFVMWQSGNDNVNIYGARVSTSGYVTSNFTVSRQTGKYPMSTVARGKSNQVLVTWSAFAPPPYNALRVWGKFSPFMEVDDQNRDKKTK
jgi:hypothetical protein